MFGKYTTKNCVCRFGGKQNQSEQSPALSQTNKVKWYLLRPNWQDQIAWAMISQRSNVCFNRGLGKNAEQCARVCGGASDERWCCWLDLEYDCPLQTGGRALALQERSARRPLWRGDGLQAEIRPDWLDSNTQWTLGKNLPLIYSTNATHLHFLTVIHCIIM